MNGKTVLVVDDDESLRRVTQMQLEAAGYQVFTATDAPGALETMEEHVPSLVVTDVRIPGMSGLDLLRELRSRYPETTVILIAGCAAVQTAVEAMKAGAYDYIVRPIDYHELLLVLARALERRSLVEEVDNPRVAFDKSGFESIIGNARPLMRVLGMARRAALTDSVVLISGETGTGKELLAKAMHQASRRRNKPFAIINCGAIPKDLLESELFGHTKGAFTGATAHKRGRVEVADGGTLFLDEIGELPPELQVKLLRLIQHGEIEKIGSTGATCVDVRIIAATHRNLRAMVEEGAFREDLYYRLAVIPLELPPLRERAEDIPDLTQYLFQQIKQKHGRPELRLPASLLRHFAAHDWPGNVRELENIIERLVVLAAGPEITFEDLPEPLRRETPAIDELRLDLPSEKFSLEAVEKELIVRALRKFSWNQTKAANYLDISRRTLIYRMEKYGLRKQ